MKASHPNHPPKQRHWLVPPALAHGGESLEGAQVLDEVRDPLGLLLWETYRDVALWTSTPKKDRVRLFAAGAAAARRAALEAAGADPALERALRGASAVLADPAGAQEQDVMTACRQAADWAEQRGLLATALAFATAAALVSPTDAAAAARIGRVARMRAENARAETWYRRTIALARRSGDWLSYSEAFLRLGNLYRLRGNFPVARRFYLRGLRAARRHALREVQGGALHGLFSVSREAYPPAEAQELARQAFQVYGPGHPQLPDLAHQVAHFWMIQGWFAPALDVFRALVSHFHDSSVRLGHLANVVFTAGAVGDRAAFEVAWEEMWDAAAEWDRMPLAPLLLLTVAGGARRLRDWARVERAAETARDVAEREWMGWVVKEAERVLDAARRRQAVEEAPVAASEGLEDTGSFAAELVSSLRKVTAE